MDLDTKEWIADLEQNVFPKGRLALPPHMFSLVCHGSVWNNQLKRCMLGKEHCFVMGLPVFRTDNLFPMPFNVNQQSEAFLKHVAGNAMDCMVVTAWTAYMLAHIEARSVIPPLLPLGIDSDNDDDAAILIESD